MKALHMVAWILVIVGALNWGLVGALNFNLVMYLLGVGIAAKVVYVLVGLSAIYELVTHKQTCKACSSGASQPTM